MKPNQGRTAFFAAALLLAPGTAQAQTYPARSVQMLLGFSAGASVDLMARAVAEEMSALLGQRYLVVNREGASGVTALDVPFKGDAAMIPALLGGTVDFGIPSVLSAAGQRERLRVLHVFGPPNQGLNGLFAPKGTPREVLRRLESACEKAVKSEKLAELAKRYHSSPDYLGSADFARVVAEDYRRKGEMIKTLPLRR